MEDKDKPQTLAEFTPDKKASPQPPPYAHMPVGPPPSAPLKEPREAPEKIWGEEIKVGRGFFSIVARLLRAREHLFADIRDNRVACGDVIGMVIVSFVCFVLYGVVMGLYNPRFFPMQSLYGGIKLPLVFFGTLVVCILPFRGLQGLSISVGQSGFSRGITNRAQVCRSEEGWYSNYGCSSTSSWKSRSSGNSCRIW